MARKGLNPQASAAGMLGKSLILLLAIAGVAAILLIWLFAPWVMALLVQNAGIVLAATVLGSLVLYAMLHRAQIAKFPTAYAFNVLIIVAATLMLLYAVNPVHTAIVGGGAGTVGLLKATPTPSSGIAFGPGETQGPVGTPLPPATPVATPLATPTPTPVISFTQPSPEQPAPTPIVTPTPYNPGRTITTYGSSTCTSCGQVGPCPGGQVCSAFLTCIDKKPLGQECGCDGVCLSNACYDPPGILDLPICVQCETDQQCDDGNSCTLDSCNSSHTCSHTSLGCGNNCGGSDVCDSSNVCAAPKALGTDCTCDGMCSSDRCFIPSETDDAQTTVAGVGTCVECFNNDDCCTNEAQGVVDDTPFCSDQHTCVECLADTDCNDNNTCTVDTCNAGVCKNDARVCGARCDGDGFTGAGTAELISVGLVCNATASCGPKVANGGVCACDGVCLSGNCLEGVCVECKSALNCSDRVACTVDSCSGDTHTCLYSPDNGLCSPSSNECQSPVCTGTGCGLVDVANDTPCTLVAENDIEIDDEDDGVCSGGTCVECNDAGDCDDKVSCTVDTCVAHVCVSTPSDAACTDSEACTFDSCDRVLGCQHSDNSTNCADPGICKSPICTNPNGCGSVNDPSGTMCPTGVCDGGGNCVECVNDSQCGGETKYCSPSHTCVVCNNDTNCDDGVACTEDVCITPMLCLNLPDNSACPDDLACMVPVCDAVTGCGHAVIDDDDNTKEDTACTIPGDGSGVCSSGACVQCNHDSDCTDAVSCTDDSCVRHVCQHTENNSLCKAPECKSPICDDATGCGTVNDPVGSLCSLNVGATFATVHSDVCDGNGNCVQCLNDSQCGGSLPPFCANNICVQCIGDQDCSDGKACTTDSCVANSCQHTDNSSLCNDNNLCTVDSCSNSTGCINSDITASCNDNKACTTDTCDPASGCVNSDNSSLCTAPECQTPICTNESGCGTTPVAANTACSIGVCNGQGACVQCLTAANCPVGNACQAPTCTNNQCGFADNSSSCNDRNACTTDSCDPASGCVHGTVTCSDSNACTADSCDSEVGCKYQTINCNDGNACTTDSCDLASGCLNDMLACGTSCNGAAPLVCNGTAQCGQLAPNGEACTCNGMCASGNCVGGVCVQCVNNTQCGGNAPYCNASNVCVECLQSEQCNDQDACTYNICLQTGVCYYPGINCWDNNACTTDSCDHSTGCVNAANSSNCNDGNACTSESCDPLNGCTSANVTCGTGCGSNLVCNANGACGSPGDLGAACACNEMCTSGACTDNHCVCNDDGDCPGQICSNGLCITPTPECSQDSDCKPGSNMCVKATCSGGTCVYVDPVNCNDNNACTTDGCEPGTGCTHDAVTCNDQNPCTIDSCIAPGGCNFAPITCPIGQTCSNGNCFIIHCVNDNECPEGTECEGGDCVVPLPTPTPTPTPTPGPLCDMTSEAYVGSDRDTLGDWEGKYGNYSFILAGMNSSVPQVEIPITGGNSVPDDIIGGPGMPNVTYSVYASQCLSDGTDPRALLAPNGTSRRAACYWSNPESTVTLQIPAGNYNLAVYLLDWDSTSRAETVNVSDSTGSVIASASGFNGGVYKVFHVNGGEVNVTLTETAGANTVLSGIFIDANSTSAPVSYIGEDTATQGDWSTNYGNQWYVLTAMNATPTGGDLSTDPIHDFTGGSLGVTYSVANGHSYAWNSFTQMGGCSYYEAKAWAWNGETTDPRALQGDSSSWTRRAACWDSDSSALNLDVDLNVTPTGRYLLSVYAMDFDSTCRAQAIQLYNKTTGALIATGPDELIGDGAYYQFFIAGGQYHIVANMSGCTNAVISGIFVDKVDCLEDVCEGKEVGEAWAASADAQQGKRKDGSAVPSLRSNVASALGANESSGSFPDSSVTAPDGSFYALGFGGNMTLAFGGPLKNGAGDDVRIYETTWSEYPPETAQVYASQNGINWTLLGSVSRDGTVDLGSLAWASFIKIVDTTDKSDSGFNGEADAYDLDAVKAMYACPEEEPGCASDTECPATDACHPGVCTNGECTTTELVCQPDSDPCTNDVCDPSLGCQHPPILCASDEVCDDGKCIGTECDDDDPNSCPEGDSCESGICVPIPECANNNDCDDHINCTVDTCDANSKCHNDAVVCNGGTLCDVGTCNETNGGLCDYVPKVCTPSNACVDSACDLSSGQCAETAKNCDDGLGCTSDACDASSGCTHAQKDCSDGNLCTDDACTEPNGTCENTPKKCSSTDPCLNGACNMTTGTCDYTPTACAPPDACHTGFCNATGSCEYPEITNCEACNVVGDCDQGNKCQDATCDLGVCHYTSRDNCEPCTTPTDCAQANLCNLATCPNGMCVYTQPDCTDASLCTIDSCVNATGCVNTRKDCSSSDLCVIGSCDESSGNCIYPAKNCSSTNPCDVNGVCNSSTGICEYQPKICQPPDICHTGMCNATGDCVFTPIPGCCLTACTDSDGGRNYSVQGTTTGQDGGVCQVSQTDYCGGMGPRDESGDEDIGVECSSELGDVASLCGCTPPKKLHEFYCDGLKVTEEIVDCPPGTVCKDGRCVEKTVPCIDSDGGVNDTVKGWTSGKDWQGHLVNKTDYCGLGVDDISIECTGSSLHEFYCDGNVVKEKLIECREGYECKNGRCVEKPVPCVDSDGGVDVDVKGTTSGLWYNNFSKVNVTDYCVNTQAISCASDWMSCFLPRAQLREYSCQSGLVRENTVYCDTYGFRSCVNGACTNAKP